MKLYRLPFVLYCPEETEGGKFLGEVPPLLGWRA